MPEGLGPRFALEAGFLILLAAVAAYARLSAVEIILVMAGGWLLASVFEVLAARRERLYPGERWERRVEVVEQPVEPEPERRRSWFRRPAEDAAPPEQEPIAPRETQIATEDAPLATADAPLPTADAPLPTADAPVPVGEEPRAAPEAPAHVVPEPEPSAAEEEPAVAEPSLPAEPALRDQRLSISPSAQVEDEATGEIAAPAPRRRWFRRSRPKPEEAAPEVVARPSARHVRLIRGTKSEDGVAEERKDLEAGS